MDGELRSPPLRASTSLPKSFFPTRRNLVSGLLIVCGLTVLAYPVVTQVVGAVYQYKLRAEWQKRAVEQAKLSKELEKSQLEVFGRRGFEAEEAVLRAGSPSPGGNAEKKPFPDTRIVIPKIGLDQVVLEGTDAETLEKGPGHYPETANPGDKGNIGIAGHRVTYARSFNRIDELKPGDSIILETLGAIYEYRVERSEVTAPEDVSNLRPTEDSRLTLTTCTPKYSAQSRLNVVAKLFKTTERGVDLASLVNGFPESNREPVAKGEIENAVEKAVDAIKRNPRDLRARLSAAAAYLEIENYGKAFEHFRFAAALGGGRADVERLRARFDVKEAELREDAIGAQNGDSYHRLYGSLRLGDFLFFKGDYRGAIEAYEEASRAEPYAADVLYYLALSYERVGNSERALELLKYAVELSPDYEEAVNELAKLQKKGVLSSPK